MIIHRGRSYHIDSTTLGCLGRLYVQVIQNLYVVVDKPYGNNNYVFFSLDGQTLYNLTNVWFEPWHLWRPATALIRYREISLPCLGGILFRPFADLTYIPWRTR